MKNADSVTDAILRHLPGHVRAPLSRAAPILSSDAQEIILRADRPVAVECFDRRCYLTANGSLTAVFSEHELPICSLSDLQQTFKSVCAYSVYAYQRELNRGYITIDNGVRVGVCGTTVENDSGIVNIKDITTLSFRMSREVIGCGNELLSQVDPLGGILVCGAPCSGKTTVIRDMARSLSYRYKVCIIDERNELSAAAGGMFGCDVGMCDVLVGMRKGDGVIHALRSLSPDIIVCDELGDRTDAQSLSYALRCGCAFIATIHARDIDDLNRRPVTAGLMKSGAFRYTAILYDRHHAGKIRKITEWGGGSSLS